MQEEAQKLADDLLEGVPAASEFTEFRERQICHMVRVKSSPFTKVGAKLIFRKSELNRRFSSQSAAA